MNKTRRKRNYEQLIMKFKVARNRGVEYVRKNFEVEPVVINTRYDK